MGGVLTVFKHVVYEHSDLPGFKSKKAMELAKELYEDAQWREKSRQELTTQIWPACDDALMCKRKLPRAKGIKWATRGAFGDTDVRDAVLLLANAITLEMIPVNDAFIEMYAHQSQDQHRKNMMRDYQSSLHRKSDTRTNYSAHVVQTLDRGVGAIGWEWRKKEKLKRIDFYDALDILIQENPIEDLELASEAQVIKEINKIRRRTRVPYTVFNGPVVYPVDMYDVLPDPAARIGADDDIPVCIIKYKTLDELKNTQDELGDKKYHNLDKIEALSLQELFTKNKWKYRSMKTLGINPFSDSGGSKYVPVYVFHRQVQEQPNSKDRYIDTYFEVALGNAGTPYLIAAYENPSDMGHPCIFFDTYSEFIAQTPYQTGVVEKALEAYNSKNVISALALQSQLVAAFPPVAVIADMLDDDSKFEAHPGGVTHIKNKGNAQNFVTPLQIASGAKEAMQFQQFYGTKISSSMGLWGAIMDAPDRQITRSKTATQVNTESTSGAIDRDNIIQKFIIRSLEPLCQAILHASIQFNTEEIVKFERAVDTKIIGGELTQEDFELDWQLVVIGSRAKLNRQQEMENLQNAYQYAATSKHIEMNPNISVLAEQLLFEIFGRLGVKEIEQYKQDPIQTLLAHPVIQQKLQQLQQQAFDAGLQQAQTPLLEGQSQAIPLLQGGDNGAGQQTIIR